MGYDFIRNGCRDGFKRYKWSSLGRCQSAAVSIGIDELGRLFTWGQNTYGEAGQGDPAVTAFRDYIELATQIGVERNWLKAYSAEHSSMALNKKGELWATGQAYEDCASFGLPVGSGGGVDNDEFYVFTLCNNSRRWIDFIHDFYSTMAMDENKNLYFFGADIDGTAGQGNWDDLTYRDPVIIPGLSNIKLIDGEYSSRVAVTEDNKVYIWGYYWGYGNFYYNSPTLLTGLPVGAEIVDVSASPYGVYVVLADGTLWAAGYFWVYGDNGVTGGSDIFLQVPGLTNNIVKVKAGGLGGFITFVLDDKGNIWGTWASLSTSGWKGDGTTSSTQATWTLIGDGVEDGTRYIDMCPNTHNRCCMAIDEAGYLYTWNSQYWGPHFATGTIGWDSPSWNPEGLEVHLYRPTIGYASEAIEGDGDPAYLNTFSLGESPYI